MHVTFRLSWDFKLISPSLLERETVTKGEKMITETRSYIYKTEKTI